MTQIYTEELLEHYKDPCNRGVLKEPTLTAHQRNPLCGDDIQLDILINEGMVQQCAFSGSGCALSIAAASLLTECIKHKEISEVTNITEDDMLELLGIEISEVRKKCALLAFATLQDALNTYAI